MTHEPKPLPDAIKRIVDHKKQKTVSKERTIDELEAMLDGKREGK